MSETISISKKVQLTTRSQAVQILIHLIIEGHLFSLHFFQCVYFITESVVANTSFH